MRMIPLNLLTLYADLAQRITPDDVPAASITRRMMGGQRRIYATFPGGVRKQVYLGTAGDPKAEAKAIAHIRAADEARANRKTVTTLKRVFRHQIFTRGASSPPLPKVACSSAVSYWWGRRPSSSIRASSAPTCLLRS
jgi:hypothetical protein